MVRLGDRDFEVVSKSTIEWDVTLLMLLQGCGLADVSMHEGEDAEQLAFRVFRTLMSSGAVFEILACVLVPAGTDPYAWTPTLMKETSAFIRKLHTEEDKAAIRSQIVSLVAGFFQHGLLSISTSRSSFTRSAEETTTSSPPTSPAISTSVLGH